MKKILWVVIGVVFVALLVLYYPKSYDKYNIEMIEGERCDHYYESCRCFGSLSVGESLPPQYWCDYGWEICSDIDYISGCRTIE